MAGSSSLLSRPRPIKRRDERGGQFRFRLTRVPNEPSNSIGASSSQHRTDLRRIWQQLQRRPWLQLHRGRPYGGEKEVCAREERRRERERERRVWEREKEERVRGKGFLHPAGCKCWRVAACTYCKIEAENGWCRVKSVCNDGKEKLGRCASRAAYHVDHPFLKSLYRDSFWTGLLSGRLPISNRSGLWICNLHFTLLAGRVTMNSLAIGILGILIRCQTIEYFIVYVDSHKCFDFYWKCSRTLLPPGAPVFS